MTTKQKPAARRSKPAARPKPAAKRSTGRAARPPRSRASTRGPGRPARPAADRSGADAVSSLLEGHGQDAAGLGLVAIGVLGAIGIYADAAGPLGAGLAAVSAGLVGRLDVLVPPALVLGGVLVILGPRRAKLDLTDAAEPDPAGLGDDARPAHLAVRRTLGGILAALAVVGLLQVGFGQGRSVTDEGLDAYAGAGGLIGAGIAGAFARFVGRWGALAVLLVLAVLAVSLLTGRSLRTLCSDVARGVAPVLRRLTSWLSDLFRLDQRSGGGTDDSTDVAGVALYDQDVDAPAKPKRSRARKPSGPDVVVAASPEVDPEQLEIELPPGVAGSVWRLPSPKLLSLSKRRAVDEDAVRRRGDVLVSALAEHGVQTRIVGMTVGPTVTRYELELGTGVKVARVTSLHRDIAYAMASPDVRILAPIPGRQAIGVEVPNARRDVVNLGDILASEEARHATHPLQVAVGRDIDGMAKLMNLATMPHLLIAGQTGAGKSSCINSIITSVMMRATPEQVRMILIDPKRVELTQYNRIPHLLTQVVANPKKAANALSWAVKEMERRYDLLSEVGVRDITGYNARFDRGELAPKPGEEREFQRLPFILIVVDELADLMMVAPRDVEESICRIAQMARAVGLHLVIATQRPSVNVITGVIKANVPARLAFAVASATDSKVILDQVGAERLVGRGDMLLLEGGSSAPERIQGAWVEESEVASVVAAWRRQAPDVESGYVAEVQGTDDGPGAIGGGSGDDDDLVSQAMELVVRSGLGSTSMLQRKLKVGFARAGRLMDLLEERGVVGPSEGSKARDVLMSPEELDNLIESGAL